MISYELPMALAIAAPLLMLNTLSLREMVDMQAGSFRIPAALDIFCKVRSRRSSASSFS